MDSTDIVYMVCLSMRPFLCRNIFNVDLRKFCDQIFTLSCFRREFATTEGKLERLPYRDVASTELRTVVKELDLLECMSHLIVNDFKYVFSGGG